MSSTCERTAHWRGGRLGMVLAAACLALLLNGCYVSTPQVGVTLGSDGEPVVVVYPCGGTVTNVSVRDWTDWVPGSDPPAPVADVWEIEGSSRADGLQEFTVGEVPDGFTELHDSDAALDAGRAYTAGAKWSGSTHSPGSVNFDVEELEEGVVRTADDPPASLDEFESRARGDCSSPFSRFSHNGLPGLGLWLLVPLAFMVAIGAAVLALVVRANNRRVAE